VDIRNGSGDPGRATELAARLAAAGIQVGPVTQTEDAVSAVQYPDGQGGQAAVLAAALGAAGSEQAAAVGAVTLVIGGGDPDRLFAAPSLC
jgi:uncharacterized protein with von Willebrand factor type A (vWA) domain